MPREAPDKAIELTPPPAHVRGAVVWVGFSLPLFLGLLVATTSADSFLQMLKWGSILVVGLIAYAAGVSLRKRRMTRHLRIGADGIHVRQGSGKENFVPWDQVIGLVRGMSHRFFLRTTDGDLLLGTDIGHGQELKGPTVSAIVAAAQKPSWAPGLPRDARLGDVIAAAKAHYAARESRCQVVLADVERSDWERVLRESMDSGDYRGRGLTRADLVTDLENPSADPELRALIARVIRPRVDEAERMRQTLNAVAAPKVRVALEEALEELKRETKRVAQA